MRQRRRYPFDGAVSQKETFSIVSRLKITCRPATSYKESMQPIFWVSIGAALIILLLGALLRKAKHQARFASKKRNARAIAGESAAELLLEDEGFSILERQVRGTWEIYVDDDPIEVNLRADLLVERDDEIFIAEVKTGRLAPDPNFPATRRQLLEYQLAFDVDGVLLVSPEQETIVYVYFPCVHESDR